MARVRRPENQSWHRLPRRVPLPIRPFPVVSVNCNPWPFQPVPSSLSDIAGHPAAAHCCIGIAPLQNPKYLDALIDIAETSRFNGLRMGQIQTRLIFTFWSFAASRPLRIPPYF
jgi:hypothetical protein